MPLLPLLSQRPLLLLPLSERRLAMLLMVPATMSASFAFMLPVATPPNAIVYGSGWVSIARMSRAGIWLNFLGAVLVTSAVIALVGNLST